MLLLLAACSEYELQKPPEEVEGVSPEIEVNPTFVAVALCAGPETVPVTIQNVGATALTIQSITIDNPGWTFPPPPLPLTLAPDTSTVLTLTGSAGTATLTIESDDADEAVLQVPLAATVNEAPVVAILAPTDATIIAEGADLTLSGTVSDDADPPDSLSLSWTASTDGVLSTTPAASDGTTTHPWPAAARTSGPQSVTLTATDTCGAIGTATVALCQDGAYTYEALDLTAWHYEGSSYYDAVNAYLTLTEPLTDQVGTAFETSSPVNGDNVEIDFTFFIGGGSGADGISLTALDVDRMTTFLGGTGCGIGYGGGGCSDGPALPGWSIEVDTYYNGGYDPTELDHVAFTFDGDVAGPQAWATLPEIEDTGWHQMVVRVLAPRVTVTIDGTTLIDGDYGGYFGFPAYVGFTAGTGSQTNYHLIDSLLVTDYACD